MNENHTAGWIIVALSLTVGYLCAGVAGDMRHFKSDGRHRLLWLSSRDPNELVLIAFVVPVMALALVLTLSSSGILCLGLALLLDSLWPLGDNHERHVAPHPPSPDIDRG